MNFLLSFAGVVSFLMVKILLMSHLHLSLIHFVDLKIILVSYLESEMMITDAFLIYLQQFRKIEFHSSTKASVFMLQAIAAALSVFRDSVNSPSDFELL